MNETHTNGDKAMSGQETKEESIEDLKTQLAGEQGAREIYEMLSAELTLQLESSRERTHEERERWRKEVKAHSLHFYTGFAFGVFAGVALLSICYN